MGSLESILRSCVISGFVLSDTSHMFILHNTEWESDYETFAGKARK
jgi:hypothetical protein